MEQIGIGKTYFTINYGCQMNESDTEHYAAQLISLGYEQAERIEQADVIVFNTCCVRESAEQKILGKIGEITHLKKRNKNLILVIAGCMAQKEGKNLIKKFPYIDCVIGTHYVNSFLEIMQAFLADRKRIVLLEQNADAINGALDVVMYASSQEDVEDYNASYSKLAMIFNGGEIPSQQDMMRSD